MDSSFNRASCTTCGPNAASCSHLGVNQNLSGGACIQCAGVIKECGHIGPLQPVSVGVPSIAVGQPVVAPVIARPASGIAVTTVTETVTVEEREGAYREGDRDRKHHGLFGRKDKEMNRAGTCTTCGPSSVCSCASTINVPVVAPFIAQPGACVTCGPSNVCSCTTTTTTMGAPLITGVAPMSTTGTTGTYGTMGAPLSTGVAPVTTTGTTKGTRISEPGFMERHHQKAADKAHDRAIREEELANSSQFAGKDWGRHERKAADAEASALSHQAKHDVLQQQRTHKEGAERTVL